MPVVAEAGAGGISTGADAWREGTSYGRGRFSLSVLALAHARERRNSLSKKPSRAGGRALNWVQGLDLNQRPSGYEPDELPGCSTLQQVRKRDRVPCGGSVNDLFSKKPESLRTRLPRVFPPRVLDLLFLRKEPNRTQPPQPYPTIARRPSGRPVFPKDT